MTKFFLRALVLFKISHSSVIVYTVFGVFLKFHTRMWLGTFYGGL